MYAASKHAVLGLTKTAPVEYGKHGIRVNAVSPGAVRTQMLLDVFGSEQAVDHMASVHPLSRIGRPEDIANAVVWLFSDKSSYYTGQSFDSRWRFNRIAPIYVLSGFSPTGLLTSGLTGGILLGSIMSVSLNVAFTDQQILAGAWRIPFLVGGTFALAAAMLRRWFSETAVFRRIRLDAKLSDQLPLRVVLRDHKRAIISAIASTWLVTASVVVLVLMTPSLLQKTFAVPLSQIQAANLAGAAALSVSTVLIGLASDRFGVRKIAVPFLFLLATATYALYLEGRCTSGRGLCAHLISDWGKKNTE